MNPVSNVSSHQGSTFPLEYEEKSKETAGTEKLPGGMAGGRNISPVAGVDISAMASAGRDASVAKSNDRYTSSCREPEQQAASRTASSVVPVDGVCIVRMQSLKHELNIIDQAGKSENKKQMQMVSQTRKMYDILCEVVNLLNLDDKLLKEADEKLGPVFEYVAQSGDTLTAGGLCRCKALVLYYQEDFVNSLLFFKKAREFDNDDTISFSESLLIQHFMLGIGVDSSMIREEIFDPEGFYDEIKKWLSDGEAQEEKLEESLKFGFDGDKACVVKIFRNAIKAIFTEEDIIAIGKVKCFIDELTRFEGSKPATSIMKSAVYILEFAMNSRLVKQGRFQEALENIKLTEEQEFKYLGDYIRCQVSRKAGEIDQAIKMCEQSLKNGCPFENYLSRLRLEKVEAEQKTVDSDNK